MTLLFVTLWKLELTAKHAVDAAEEAAPAARRAREAVAA